MSLKPQLMRQPFEFDKENKKKVMQICARYPADRCVSAVMPLLDLAQRQCKGWLPQEAMETVAQIVGVTPLRVWEVASFYSMYHLRPVGRHHIQICRTASCYLKGAGDLTKRCQKKLKIALKETDEAGDFSLEEVECLGACVNAPVVQINDDYYENLTPETLDELIGKLEKGKNVKSAEKTAAMSTAPFGYHPTASGEKRKTTKKTEGTQKAPKKTKSMAKLKKTAKKTGKTATTTKTKKTASKTVKRGADA